MAAAAAAADGQCVEVATLKLALMCVIIVSFGGRKQTATSGYGEIRA